MTHNKSKFDNQRWKKSTDKLENNESTINKRYRLRETNDGGLEINKFNENKTAISISPIMSNEIVIV